MRAGYLHSGEGEGEGQVRASEGNALGRSGGKDDAPARHCWAQGPAPPAQEDTHVAAAAHRRITPSRDTAPSSSTASSAAAAFPAEGDDC